MTSTGGKLTEKICRTAEQATTHHYTAKSQASYLKMLKETILPDTEAAFFRELFIFMSRCHTRIPLGN
jgi:hypothetical protein